MLTLDFVKSAQKAQEIAKKPLTSVTKLHYVAVTNCGDHKSPFLLHLGCDHALYSLQSPTNNVFFISGTFFCKTVFAFSLSSYGPRLLTTVIYLQ